MREIIAGREPAKIKLLDIGCSTGNLLRHLHRTFPTLSLTGGDVAESSIDHARRDPELACVHFDVMDIRSLPNGFDIVTVNAVLYMMSDDDFRASLSSIARSLNPGGSVIVFDLFHALNQRLTIIEKTPALPSGECISMWPTADVAAWAIDAGLIEALFRPFDIGIDLPRHTERELCTYTVKTADGQRMSFRGALFQPWCHMTAGK